MNVVVLSLCTALLTSSAGAFDHSHAKLDATLKQQVKNGRVHYAALKANRSNLDQYLAECSRVSQAEFGAWSPPQQLAYLINLYNAATLQLIIDHYPVKSIKDIGGLFKGPWKQECVGLFGQKVTLDHIEHQLIRPNYHEPRAHFALVCAANGCPPLRNGAYTAPHLNEQLEEQGRLFLRTPTKNRVDSAGKTVYLSPVFNWFSEDFERPGRSLLEFVTPYFTPADQKVLASSRDWKVRYTKYDWALNNASAN